MHRAIITNISAIDIFVIDLRVSEAKARERQLIRTYIVYLRTFIIKARVKCLPLDKIKRGTRASRSKTHTRANDTNYTPGSTPALKLSIKLTRVLFALPSSIDGVARVEERHG